MIDESAFLMVTNMNLHWDLIGRVNSKNETWFTLPMIKWEHVEKGLPKEDTETIFIKRSKDGRFEKAWKGIVKDIRYGKTPNNPGYQIKDCVWFSVALEKEISNSISEMLKQKKEGWYLFKQPETPTVNNLFHLKLFDELRSESDYRMFEEHCFYLLRLIGLHDVHRFPSNQQGGKADGFFKFGKLAVIYDATLNPNLSEKQTQISNYIKQLKDGKFEKDDLSYQIHDCDKQVWIIVQSENSTMKERKEDGIRVRIIAVERLISIFKRRISIELDSDEFCDLLKNF